MTDPTPTSPPHRTPRWVKVVAVVVGVLIVLVVAVMLLSGGNHGPGRHLSAPAAVVHPMISADGVDFSPDAWTGPILR
ncbi:hypothetical protein [Gordonia pseudamarae]|jgi:hypothetical protein|uniref:hypothetical protein n=1 Tax=Gordonia pseudamarae TaxID=2831662 RepID=UPI001AF3C28B|nr:hypothetical protein [Gordonia pseudamarae]QHN28950.1 hypothetical protein GII33_22960 [Gordonia pseudamarae]HMT33196.1 hypothetical protein [Dermatophilaceae bacterium]